MNRAGLAGSAAGAILIVFLVVRSLAPLPGNASPAPQGQHSAEGAQPGGPGQQAAVPGLQDGPWKASRQHFIGIRPEGDCVRSPAVPSEQHGPVVPAQAVKQSTAEIPREWRWCIPDEDQVQPIIAIVPDPVHTHMSLLFDRSVEAIQLAAQPMQYVVDRYWLPWKVQDGSGTMSGDALQQFMQEQEQKELQPGLLMFRWDGSADVKVPRLLYVFLVAETSTAGINIAQFSRAVDYLHEICADVPPHRSSSCANANVISIMGPTFSGSLASLRAFAAARSPRQFAVFSGTVSSICAMQDQGLLAEPNHQLCQEASDYERVQNITFLPLQRDAQTAVAEFVRTMQENGGIDCTHGPQIAILSEAATTYGASQRPGAGRKTSAENCAVSFSYPREIASLRNAYSATGGTVTAAADKATNAGPSYLPFNLTDREPNLGDEPPDFSRLQGPLSKEAVVMNYAAELRRGGYRYIGVIGSNVLDVMFLAGFLRQACPDTRLFVLNADLLFERQLDNVPYIGTMDLTTYPLVDRNLNWTSPRVLARLPFADQYEEGQFNATVLALRKALDQKAAGELYEYRAPFTDQSGDFQPGPTQPPLWLTAVGTGGFWPVQVLSMPAGEKHKDGPDLASSDFSAAWKFIVVILCTLAFLHILVLLKASLLSELRDFALLGYAQKQRLFFIHVASATLALALGVAAAPAWSFGLQAGLGIAAIAVIVPLAILGLFLACVGLDYDFRDRCLAANDLLAFRQAAALHTGIWAVAVVVEWFWRTLLGCSDGLYGFFFAYRAVHLATGVSPLMPLLPLFLAIYIWTIFEIWRLRFDDWVRPRLNTTGSLPGALTEERIARSVNRYFLDRSYLAGFCAVFGVWLFFLQPAHAFQLFERRTFGYLYELLFCLAVALMLSSGFRLGQTWWETRKLLRELQRSRIRMAFSRLKEPNWSPIWQSGGLQAEMTILSRSFEVLNQIEACDAELEPELKREIQNARDIRAELMQLRSGGEDRKLEDRFHALQQQLARLLNLMLGALEADWKDHCSGASAKDESGKNESVVVYCKEPEVDEHVRRMQPREDYVALRYVAFIRGVLGHVRHLLIGLAILFSLIMISLNTYSFEPHQSLIWSFTALFAVIGAMSVLVLMNAYRDQILSRITGTKPNELGLDFYVRVISLGAVPLLTFLATHFPSIGRSLVSLLQPGLEALK